jgi:hypothetical protein
MKLSLGSKQRNTSNMVVQSNMIDKNLTRRGGKEDSHREGKQRTTGELEKVSFLKTTHDFFHYVVDYGF